MLRYVMLCYVMSHKHACMINRSFIKNDFSREYSPKIHRFGESIPSHTLSLHFLDTTNLFHDNHADFILIRKQFVINRSMS